MKNFVHKLLTSVFGKLLKTKRVDLLYYNISKTHENIPMQPLVQYFNANFFIFSLCLRLNVAGH